MTEARHRLAPLLTPRSVAVVGASNRPDTPGNYILGEIRRGGFAGRLYAVNPNYSSVAGVDCYPSLAELPEAVDLAVLLVGNHHLEAQLAAAIEAGARAAVIYASCYLPGDTDPPLVERLGARAREAGIAVCGGNCMGFYNFDAGVWMCPYPVHDDPRTGPVTLISHSGSAFASMLDLGNRVGCNLAVSAGVEFTTTAADYLDYALDQPGTRIAALFLEAVRDPEAFTAALAKAVARDVPVVALKVGRTELSARFAKSHSGALAGSDRAFQAVCDRYGVVRVASLDELVATLTLFAVPRRAGPGGLAAIMDSGGEREMLVDLAADVGVRFADIGPETAATLEARLEPGLDPVNPCDAWGTMHDFEGVFGDCFRALVTDRDASVGLLFADMRKGRFLTEPYARICRAAAASCDKPVGVATFIGRQRYGDLAERLTNEGIAVLDGVEPALKAVANVLRHRDFRLGEADEPPPAPEPGVVERWRARLVDGAAPDEAEALRLLADFGVPAVAARAAEDRDAALAAADALGYPVALKTAQPGLDHKSDAGGVALGLAGRDAVAAAYDDLARRLGPRVVVAPMAPAGVELALGVTVDAQFGPLVMVGAGGILVEALRDVGFALPPFGAATARRLIESLRVRPLLDGVRGGAAADVGAVARAAAALSTLAATLGDRIAEVDVNPLIAGAAGCVAVDALVVPRTAPEGD